MHTASAGRMVRDAIDAAERLAPGTPDVDSIAADVLREMSERVASQLARSWIIGELVQALKVCSGSVPVRKSTVRNRRDGKVDVVTVEVYKHDAAGIVAVSKLLLDEADRKERAEASKTIEHQGSPERSIASRMIERAFGKPPAEPEDDDDPAPPEEG